MNKTHADLVQDLAAGNELDGDYYPTRPIVVGPGSLGSVVGHPVRKARIISNCGPAIIAGWAEPKPPAELWTADGGLRLRDNSGKDWKIGIPIGNYTHPGQAPNFWTTLITAEWTCDFKMAKYLRPDSVPVPLFGLRDVDSGMASPIMVLVQGNRLVIYYRDSTGQKSFAPKILDAADNARNKVTITYSQALGTITATTAVGSASSVVVGGLADNIDAAFHIGGISHSMYGGELWPIGDLTLYAFNFNIVFPPGTNSYKYNLPLTIPAVGDWWMGNGAILYNPLAYRDSWGSPSITIKNVEIKCSSKFNDGASILFGYYGQNSSIDNVKTSGHKVGIASMRGPSYRHYINNWTGAGHQVTSYMGKNMVSRLTNCVFSRSGRDDVIIRGGEFVADFWMITPVGDSPTNQRRASFRILAFEDATKVTLVNGTIDDEGTYPTESQIVADCSGSRFGNDMVIVLREVYMADGNKFGKLVGTPKVAGVKAFFDLTNVTSLTSNPILNKTDSWTVTGEVKPRIVVPATPVVVTP